MLSSGRSCRLLIAAAISSALLLYAALIPVDRAEAFSYNYCSYVWLSPGGSCGDGAYLNRTFNGASVFTYNKYACEQMVTAAGNVRGGTGLCGTPGVTQCLNNASPASQAYVISWAYNGGTYQFIGWTDDSPNHTRPCY